MGDFGPYVYRLTIRKKQCVVEQASESAKLWHWSCVTSNKLIQVLWTLILVKMRMKWSEVAQLCLTLCGPVDCSLPGSSVHGVFQARVLEWVAISFSRGSSWPRDRTRVSHTVGRCFYHLSHQGSCRGTPLFIYLFSLEYNCCTRFC